MKWHPHPPDGLSFNHHEILGIIPIRGGSERLPDKALLDLCGKPLMAHTIEQALKSERITRLIVSTDSDEVMKIASDYGVDTPFRRPLEIAGSELMANHALKHALNFLDDNEGYYPDYVVGLWVTYPFREDGLIDRVIDTLLDSHPLETCFAGIKSGRHVFDGLSHESLTTDGYEADVIEYKKLMYTVLYGLVNAYRPSVVQNLKWRGKSTKIVESKHPYAEVDIDYKKDLELARLIIENNNGAIGGTT